MTEDLRRQRLWLRSCACWPAFGALISAAESWRGLRFTEFELRQLDAVQIWTPSTRPLSPAQTGHPDREFPANPRLDRD
jgi:hypothetical protein